MGEQNSDDNLVSNSTGRVKGKVALITGAAQGLGKATAEKLLAEGARIFATDINMQPMHEWAKKYQDRVFCLHLDVTKEQDWQTAIVECEKAFGALHILVNNAGVGELGSVMDMPFDAWKRVHEINLDSVFLGCKNAIPLIEKSGGGSIVNISSVAGIIASENYAAYNSSKAAVRHLTKSVALYGAKLENQVRCNSVHPVFMDTPILDPFSELFGKEKMMEKLSRQIPLGRIGQPEDVANGVLFLASDESGMITGSELVIDGGISAQ
jgi:NAD(P)-dependent dehydrogenase (short-subunit alcohol dehydrogenase family)